MSKIEYLRNQAERAERLAKAIIDTLIVGTLRAFAAECGSALRRNRGQRRSASRRG